MTSFLPFVSTTANCQAELQSPDLQAAHRMWQECGAVPLEYLQRMVSGAFSNLQGPAIITDLGRPGVNLRLPIVVAVSPNEGGLVVARWEEALLEGEGSGRSEALRDIAEQVLDAYDDLKASLESGKNLRGYPLRLWTLLQAHLDVSTSPK